jgi:hypothetical protein
MMGGDRLKSCSLKFYVGGTTLVDLLVDVQELAGHMYVVELGRSPLRPSKPVEPYDDLGDLTHGVLREWQTCYL